MYPLILKPVLKDYLWGGAKLKTEYGFDSDKPIVAEGWMLSCHEQGDNIVLNGECVGMPFSEVLNLWGDACLGIRAKAFSSFPILIKLIDAKQKLSVQVHPDDEYALKEEGEYGKTEMWYVVDCDDGAELVYGFSKDISKEEFSKRIENNTLNEVCNTVSVSQGDVFFIPAGTLHAIGEGILIAEVQQNSNTTYRVSDYGRLGADGKPRELHIEKALAVTECSKVNIPYGQIGNKTTTSDVIIRELANCDKFTARHITLNGKYEIYISDSFVSLVVLNGGLTVKYDSEEIPAKKGDSIFIPAGLKVELVGTAEILYSCI